MSPPTVALCFMLLGDMAGVAAVKPTASSSSALHFMSVSVGNDVTLQCFYDQSSAIMLYWYKQPVGQKPQLISEYYNSVNNNLLKDPRFELMVDTNQHHLKISRVQISDSATYYCVSGFAYIYEFLDGTMIHVKGSGGNVPASVHGSETVQAGDSLSLNCTVNVGTCDGEHNVYWFRSSDGAQPGIIYTHGGSSDQCEWHTAQTPICVYNLLMTSLDPSHAGTYYCAVASCGHIVFGDGTKVDVEAAGGEDSLMLVYLLSGGLTFTTILVVLLAYKIYSKDKTNSCRCTDSQAGTSDAPVSNTQDTLHYAAVAMNGASRSLRVRDDTWSECVYSSVRQ